MNEEGDVLLRWVGELFRRVVRPRSKDPVAGYDLWSTTYDEDENALFSLDDRLFVELSAELVIRGKRVVDVGCGTGRHWGKILAQQPAELVGYDLSPGMLAQLRRKYPLASVHVSDARSLRHTATGSSDVVVSTLALSHLRDPARALIEWARVLRGGGEILLTDRHPACRGETTFSHGRRTVRIDAEPLAPDALRAIAGAHGLRCVTSREMPVDESVRPFFERARRLDLFDRLTGTPLVYGMRLCKDDR